MTNSELLIEKQRAAVAWLKKNRRGARVKIAAAQAKLDALIAYQIPPMKRRKHITLAETPGLMTGRNADLPKPGPDHSQPLDLEYLCQSSIRRPDTVYPVVGKMRNGQASPGASDPATSAEHLVVYHQKLAARRRKS